ncbi:hypothetical protein [Weissella cibaria]|uniref:hypothetical protein n=1 Tax=Weissella cibaria TaxID=137591 RepID=UPI00106DDE9B|nr:hypothetical protein [Weissella cibaria]
MIDLINYLNIISNRNDIKVVYSQELDAYTPDLSVPSQRKIIINRKSNNNVSVAFRLAHELSHILFGSVEQNRVYAFSIGATKSSERIAHEQAMHMIVKYVFQDTPSNIETTLILWKYWDYLPALKMWLAKPL